MLRAHPTCFGGMWVASLFAQYTNGTQLCGWHAVWCCCCQDGCMQYVCCVCTIIFVTFLLLNLTLCSTSAAFDTGATERPVRRMITEWTCIPVIDFYVFLSMETFQRTCSVVLVTCHMSAPRTFKKKKKAK